MFVAVCYAQRKSKINRKKQVSKHLFFFTPFYLCNGSCYQSISFSSSLSTSFSSAFSVLTIATSGQSVLNNVSLLSMILCFNLFNSLIASILIFGSLFCIARSQSWLSKNSSLYFKSSNEAMYLFIIIFDSNFHEQAWTALYCFWSFVSSISYAFSYFQKQFPKSSSWLA